MTNREPHDPALELLDAMEAMEATEARDDPEAVRAERSPRELEPLLARLEDDVRVPSDRMRARFYRELARWEEHDARPGLLERLRSALLRLWPADPTLQLATAVAALLFGGFAGWLAAERGRGNDLEQLRAELQQTRETFALALLDSRSAGERLQAVSLAREERESARVTEALLAVLRDDPSENVRLAALDALAQRVEERHDRRHASAPENGLIAALAEALPDQQSPMLQVALGDLLARSDSPAATPALERLLERDDLDPGVRARIEGALRPQSSL